MTFFKLLVTNQFKRVLYGAFQLDQTYSDAAVYMISGIQLVQSASQVTKKKLCKNILGCKKISTLVDGAFQLECQKSFYSGTIYDFLIQMGYLNLLRLQYIKKGLEVRG